MQNHALSMQRQVPEEDRSIKVSRNSEKAAVGREHQRDWPGGSEAASALVGALVGDLRSHRQISGAIPTAARRPAVGGKCDAPWHIPGSRGIARSASRLS